METTVERLIKLINNRSRNSLKTVFNDEEKVFWLEMSFWFGENPNYIKTSEEFFNEMYNDKIKPNEKATTN